MRPSTDSERIASPAYSMTWPVPPAVPISPMMARMMSLAVTPGGQRSVDRHPHVLRLLLDQRLRREHVLDLGRADAVRERAEGAVRRGVGIAADDRRAGKRKALFGSDDVDDALADVELAVIFDAELLRVLRKRRHLDRRFRIVDAERAVGRRHVVVDDGERLLRLAHLAARDAQTLEGLGRRHFVDEVPVDIEKARAVGLHVDHVIVPDLVVDCAGLRHRVHSCRRTAFGRSL